MSRIPEARVRPLGPADTGAVLALLRRRPIHNVLLEHVVDAGALGRLPGFFGCELGGSIEGVLMVGSLGGASLEICRAEVFAPLAAWAARLDVPPRHISGAEDVTRPFWSEYSRVVGSDLLWKRRERVYVVSRDEAASALEPRPREAGVRPARERELDELVENSAQQHREDLKEDRRAMDPDGFRGRHRSEIREGHWWVLSENGRIRFQVHVGPRNASVVQLGGVFTPVDSRGQGYATRALGEVVARLHADRPKVSLYCDEGNRDACRLYERVGFRVQFHNRSYLLRAANAAVSYA